MYEQEYPLAITKKYDSTQLQRGGDARQTTVVEFTLGKLGPFQEIFDRNPDSATIQAAIDKRRQALIGLR